MKKIFTTLFVMLAVASVAFAQPRAIGGRIGLNSTEFSYQHSLSDGMYLDLTAGYGYALRGGWGHTDITAAMDWVFNIKGIWNWFIGPAVGLGYGFGYNYWYYSRRGYYGDNLYMPFRVNIGGQVGFEWQFSIPLNLTVDWRPMVNVLGFGYQRPSGSTGAWNNLLNFGVGVRYRFH